jgi:hypothetical protein
MVKNVDYYMSLPFIVEAHLEENETDDVRAAIQVDIEAGVSEEEIIDFLISWFE